MNTLSFKRSFFATITIVVFVSGSFSIPFQARAIDTGAGFGFDIEDSFSGMNTAEDLAGIAGACLAGPIIAEQVVPAVSAITGAMATFFGAAEKTAGATNVAATTEGGAAIAAEAAALAAIGAAVAGGPLAVAPTGIPVSDSILKTAQVLSLAVQGTQAQLQAASAVAKTPKDQQSKMTSGVMDCIVYNAGQKMLEQLTNNTVSWIQGGFRGSPSFSVNTHEVFLDLADMVAGDLARDIRGIATCDFRVNYKNDLANAVELASKSKRQYKFNSSVECPFPETFQLNSSDFYNGINKWSWEGLEYAMQENGNPWGVAFLTSKELELRSSEKEEVRKQELSWANGFTNIVDTENCNYPSTTRGRYDLNEDGSITQDEWDQLVADEMITKTEAREFQRVYCKTTTPGKLLGDKLTESTGVDMQRLGLIDSINKIIGAVISQVTKQAAIGVFNAVSEEDATLKTTYVPASVRTSETIAMENASIKPYYDAWQAEIKREADAKEELAKVWSDLNLWNSGNSTITDPASLNQRRTELESIIALAPERIATAKAAYDQVSSAEMSILRQQELVAAQQEVNYAKEGVRDAEYDYTVAQTEYYKALATEIDVYLINSLKQDMLEMEAILTRQRALLQAANDRLYAAKRPAYSTSPVPLQI